MSSDRRTATTHSPALALSLLSVAPLLRPPCTHQCSPSPITRTSRHLIYRLSHLPIASFILQDTSSSSNRSNALPPVDDVRVDRNSPASSRNHSRNQSADSLPSRRSDTDGSMSSNEADEEVIFVGTAPPSSTRPPPVIPGIDIAADLGDYRPGIRRRPAAVIPDEDIINLGSESEEDKPEEEVCFLFLFLKINIFC